MKKFFACLCLLIIILLFPITLLGTVAKYRLLTPTTIKRIVRSSQIAENLPSLITAAATNAQSSNDAVTLDPTTTQDLVTTALPSEQVYIITDDVVDAIAVWWGTDKPIEQLELTIDLTTLKQNLAPALGQQLNTYLDDLPTCGNDVLPTNLDTIETLDPATLAELNCLPSNFDITNFLNGNAATMDNTMLQNIPDEIEARTFITEQLQTSNIPLQSLNQTVNQLRSYWRWFTIGIWVAWGVIGCSFLLMIVLRLRPGSAAFTWLGWTFFFMTLELAPLALLLWLAPQFILPWFSTSIDLVGITIMNTLLTDAMRVLMWPVIWTMIGAAVVMIACFVLRLITKHASHSQLHSN